MLEQFIEIIDRFGRRRRARRGEVAGDGETVHFGMQCMDGTARAVRDALAEKFGPHTGDDDMTADQRTRGFVRGFAFADHMLARAERDAERHADAATLAYNRRSKRMENSWRTKDRRDDGDADERTPPRTPPRTDTRSLDQTRAAAEAAYQAKCKRMSNAWRHD